MTDTSTSETTRELKREAARIDVDDDVQFAVFQKPFLPGDETKPHQQRGRIVMDGMGSQPKGGSPPDVTKQVFDTFEEAHDVMASAIHSLDLLSADFYIVMFVPNETPSKHAVVHGTMEENRTHD